MKKLYVNPEFMCSQVLEFDVVLASVKAYDDANLTEDIFEEDWF